MAGNGCPFCKETKQTVIYDILKGVFPNQVVEFNYNKFDWLNNPKTGFNLYLDIYIPHLKLAVEYDGEQHFFPVRFGGITKKEANKKFKKQTYRDKLKTDIISCHADDIKHFIRISYKEKKFLSKEYIIKKIESSGIIINKEGVI